LNSAHAADRAALLFVRRHIMKLPHRRQFLHLAAGAASLPVVSRIARAQAYPTRPVRIIAGFPPGGGSDILARLMGQWLSERLNQAFIVENRPGAGGNIATDTVVRAHADGYTLLLVNSANPINATLYEKLNFNFIRDIAPVASIMDVPSVMEVNPSLPAKTVPEFITYAKANPGRISMASPGIGTGSHMSGELFKMMTGVNMVQVPYRGDAPALTDLISGQVQVMFCNTVSSVEHIRAGRLRALAVTTATRSDALPDLPTLGEFVQGQGREGNRGQLRACSDALSGPSGEHGTAIWTASYSGWLTFFCLCPEPNTAWAIPSMGLA
jgi:tripartite-type tricarboxylate transporter receptor subunit TctC